MAFNRPDDTTHVLTPDDHGDVWYAPLRNESVALQVATQVTTQAAVYRTPVVLADPMADWGAEGTKIVESEPTVTEAVSIPERLAGMTVVSREMLDDSTGRAADMITTGLVQSIATKIDFAAFGNPTNPNAPAGLRGAVGVQEVDIATFVDTDAFAEAQSLTETTGRRVDSWVANPATILELQRIKEGNGSNRPLLGADVSVATGRSILGAPVYSSPFVENGVVWGLPKSALHVVLRTPAELSISTDYAFDTYSVAIRIVQRAGIVIPHAAAIVRITAADLATAA